MNDPTAVKFARAIIAVEVKHPESFAHDILQEALGVVEQSRATEMTREKFQDACDVRQDAWLPANCGTEKPFLTRSGRCLLYCYNPKLGKHAYLDCRTDIVLSDIEATTALGLIT